MIMCARDLARLIEKRRSDTDDLRIGIPTVERRSGRTSPRPKSLNKAFRKVADREGSPITASDNSTKGSGGNTTISSSRRVWTTVRS